MTSVPEFCARVKESTAGRAVRWRTPDPAIFDLGRSGQPCRPSGTPLETVTPPFARPWPGSRSRSSALETLEMLYRSTPTTSAAPTLKSSGKATGSAIKVLVLSRKPSPQLRRRNHAHFFRSSASE